jgi:hypothetical protein
MQPGWRKTTLGRIVLIGLVLGASALAVSAAGLIGTVISEEAFGAHREIQSDAEIEQPTISFIDSPSATCNQPDSSRNNCYITWNYLNVSASTSQYIISMTVGIDNRLQAYHSGFFQTSMYIPGDLYGRGFKVACGPRDMDGLGNSYAYTLRARETGGLSAANYGTVRCPGMYLVYAPSVRR